MDQPALNTITTAEEAVSLAVEECRKGGPLYLQSPKAVAQLNRTAKWFLNAVAALRRALNMPHTDNGKSDT